MRETKLWTWHILAGAVVLVLLALHMVIMHLDVLLGAWVLNPSSGKAIAWGNVMARSRMGLLAVVYILLLGAALYHGLYGLRTILFELGLKRPMQAFVNVAFWIGGIALFVLGTCAAIAAKML
jgi:succinate dehydrogenase / fumarate reductase membrane anchor subunit